MGLLYRNRPFIVYHPYLIALLGNLLRGAVYQVVVRPFDLFEQVSDGFIDKSRLARAEHVCLQKPNLVGNCSGVGNQACNYCFFVGDPRVTLSYYP